MDIEKYNTITQASAHEKTSDKYSFIPTSRVLDVLRDHGYYPAKVQEARTRIDANKGFQKHIVRLRQEKDLSPAYLAEFPEIILINSHMGSASFRLMLGYFRLVCTNGMIAGTSISDYRITHKGYTDESVSNAIIDVSKHLPMLEDTVQKMREITLDKDEKEAYAKSAIELKWDAEKNVYVDPRELIHSWRSADNAPTLWNAFNTVQEKLLKGGIRTRNANNQSRRSKAVTSVDENVRLNRALWTLTEKMAELKGVNLH